MTQIFNLSQSYVEQYSFSNHSWFTFAGKCSQNEFLSSQEGFYYAVKAFPRVLAKLASQIESSEARILVTENLWEEHGQGNNKVFHTTTYFQYLQSIGFKKEQSSIEHQPWIDEWIELVLNKNLSEEKFAMYIAGIEYIYARISYFISQLVLNYDVKGEQTHYLKHSVLDYEHAKELIQTSLLIQREKNTLSDDCMMDYFKLGIEEFLKLYENMVLLTENEAFDIAKEKHAFYYGREDVSVNKNFLSQWYKERNDEKMAQVLMVCSGGENAIEILSMNQNSSITLLDINPNQLQLSKDKIETIKRTGYLNDELSIYNVGKFERIFSFLRNSLSYEELEKVSKKEPLALKKLKYICNNIFSNKILEIVFTENATKYSKDNFAEHFNDLLVKQIVLYFEKKPKYSNIGSILFNESPMDYQVKINTESSIDYFNGDFLTYFSQNDKNFDLIDLSNISDWLPLNEIKKIVSTAYSKLNKNGVIVGRKLLGDYQWNDLQENLDDCVVLPVTDKTMFYKECVLLQKK